MIKKLFQVLINSILLADKEEEEKEMEIPHTVICKTCKNLTAHLKSYASGFAMYHCDFCKSSFGGGNYNIDNKGNEQMGKKKNKKGKKGIKHKETKKHTDVKSTTISRQDDAWEVKIDCVEHCSKAPDKIDIWVHPLAKRKIDTLMDEYKNIEWLAYLIGKKEEKEVIDIFVPDQKITTASVDNIICEEYNDIVPIGVIHSHHTMGHRFSHTDHEWINQNHDISLVISNSGISGQYRAKVECGAYKIVDVNVRLKVDIEFDDKQWIESIKDKIQRRTYTSQHYNYGSGGWHEYNGHGYAHGYGGWRGHQSSVIADDDNDDTKQLFLTQDELDEIEKEIEELDFEKELSLAEELELLEETNNLDDVDIK